jgi:hypothetical protein
MVLGIQLDAALMQKAEAGSLLTRTRDFSTVLNQVVPHGVFKASGRDFFRTGGGERGWWRERI